MHSHWWNWNCGAQKFRNSKATNDLNKHIFLICTCYFHHQFNWTHNYVEQKICSLQAHVSSISSRFLLSSFIQFKYLGNSFEKCKVILIENNLMLQFCSLLWLFGFIWKVHFVLSTNRKHFISCYHYIVTCHCDETGRLLWAIDLNHSHHFCSNLSAFAWQSMTQVNTVLW